MFTTVKAGLLFVAWLYSVGCISLGAKREGPEGFTMQGLIVNGLVIWGFMSL